MSTSRPASPSPSAGSIPSPHSYVHMGNVPSLDQPQSARLSPSPPHAHRQGFHAPPPSMLGHGLTPPSGENLRPSAVFMGCQQHPSQIYAQQHPAQIYAQQQQRILRQHQRVFLNPFSSRSTSRTSSVRPPYVPHENLWFSQQTNQELHRRHMVPINYHVCMRGANCPGCNNRSLGTNRRRRMSYPVSSLPWSSCMCFKSIFLQFS